MTNIAWCIARGCGIFEGIMVPADPQHLLQSALQLHQQGRLQEAHSLYRQVLERQPQHPDALHLLGVLLHQAGQPARAVELITNAIALRPSV